MDIHVTYFDGREVKVEDFERVKAPQLIHSGIFTAFHDEYSGSLKCILLTTRVVRMDFTENHILPAKMN